MKFDIQAAAEEFGNGVSCAMVVFGELAELVGVDKETARKIASAFCGSMEKHNFCGCVSGAKMALGMKYGGCRHGDTAEAKKLMAKVKEFEEQFIDEFGSVHCHEMLDGLDVTLPEEAAIINERGLKQRICPAAISFAVETVADMIEEDDF